MSNKTSLLELIKNKNLKEIENIIKKDKNINLNINDTESFIYYVLMFNYENILDLVLKRKNIRLDILDAEKRTILYNPIKFNYISVLKKLLIYDSKNIGINIIDIKDKINNSTALHYSIIYDNFEAFKILLDYNANITIVNNKKFNSFHLCILYNKNNEFLIFLLNKINEINFFTNDGENIIHFCIKENKENYISLILKKNMKPEYINSQEKLNGLTALHYAIIKNFKSTIIELIHYKADINIPDYYANTSLHYAVSEKNNEIIKIFLKYAPNYDFQNIDGDTALHMYLDNNNMDIEILENLILKTNLNIQNNNGVTCLKKLLYLDLFMEYIEILENKELNFFITDKENENMDEYLENQSILRIAINSYYNTILIKKENLIEVWEKKCADLKLTDKDCKETIKKIITKDKHSLPQVLYQNIFLDEGIFVDSCRYTGFPIDILFGIIYVYNTFKKNNFSLLLDYPLTKNEQLENRYKELGINYPFKLDFSNCEIIWCYQKIFYPTYFDYELEKKMKDKYIKYFAIPLGIEVDNNAHANILFIDKVSMTIERFEPNGANNPIGLNYNPNDLDTFLINKFNDYGFTYFKPNDFLPIIGFQMLENSDGEYKCRRVHDLNGFCGVWCTWWIFHRLKNISIKNTELASGLINHIKNKNLSFKKIIRNFTHYITELRDKELKKYDIDFNDWFVGNVTPTIVEQMGKDVLNML
jgi:ankyrin repeat protein